MVAIKQNTTIDGKTQPLSLPLVIYDVLQLLQLQENDYDVYTGTNQIIPFLQYISIAYPVPLLLDIHLTYMVNTSYI